MIDGNTEVLTVNSHRKISELNVGDKLHNGNEVVSISKVKTSGVIYITILNAEYTNAPETLVICDEKQEFKTASGFIEVGQLERGEILNSIDDKPITIIQRIEIPDGVFVPSSEVLYKIETKNKKIELKNLVVVRG